MIISLGDASSWFIISREQVNFDTKIEETYNIPVVLSSNGDTTVTVFNGESCTNCPKIKLPSEYGYLYAANLFEYSL